MAFTIPSGVFTKYSEIADAMLATTGFGTTCQLIYVDKIETISQSVPNVKHKKVMNLQRMGADSGFKRGASQFKTVETTENIVLRTYWSKKDFNKVGDIELPDGSVMCIGDYDDLQKIYKASFLSIESDKTNHKPWRFEKAAEPMVFGLNNNYLVSYWKRA
jgi:hypothetical protein